MKYEHNSAGNVRGNSSGKKTGRPYGFAISLILLAILLVAQGCSKPVPLPAGWSAHAFKLIEHPESLISPKIDFDDVRGQLTVDRETRQGFMLGVVHELEFDVAIPIEGSLKFAYGYNPDAGLSGEVKLSASVSDSSGVTALGTWRVNLEASGREEVWTDVSVPVSGNGTAGSKLKFSVSGITGKRNPDAFLLGHPALVTSGKGAKPRRVIWIAIDTLRADHLGCYGYERNTSPNIDKFARSSTLYERCISSSPWTFPSFSSMFTGKNPSIAGALTSVRYLPDDEGTLTEIISSKDYATLAINNNPWIGVTSNLHRGFDTHIGLFKERGFVSLDMAEKWLDAHADEDCFVFIQLLDPHTPYNPKKKNKGKFNSGYNGKSYKTKMEHYDQVRNGKKILNAGEKVQIEALYDEEIFGCDEDIGNFLDFLKKKKYLDDSLLIINSDHGEEFWEHGGYEHGHTLYDEVLHVPLIIHGPGFDKGKREPRMVGAMDIFPTILDWLEMEIPDGLNAVSLLDADSLPNGGERRILSEQLYFGIEQKGISTDGYRYIFHTEDLMEELYDIEDDPEMLYDVVMDRRGTSREFRNTILAYTISENIGWHVRIYRTTMKRRLGAIYEGTIMAPSGFASVSPTSIDEDDSLVVDGNTIRFRIKIDIGTIKAFDFSTNNENELVEFDIVTDGDPWKPQWVFIGPDMLQSESTEFSMSILDKAFGLGQPQLGAMGPKYHGFFLWGNSQALRSESIPAMDEATRQELKALGYLN